MEQYGKEKFSNSPGKKLFWTGIATLLTSLKLLLSYFVPGLKTSGELVISGILLLACAWQIFDIYALVKLERPLLE